MSRVFRLEDKNVRSVWIPPFEVSEEVSLGADQVDPEESLRQARHEAELIKERAEKEAASILQNAESKYLEYCEQAKQSGFKIGCKEGFHKGLQETRAIVNQAQETLESSKKAFETYVKESEPKLLALVLDIAEKIVGESLSYDPELILSMLRNGIEVIGDERQFSLRVNPQLVALLEGGKDKLQGQYGNRPIEIIGDQSVSTGVIVETPAGQVDATLDAQIKNIARAIGEAKNRLGEGRIL
ncbi:MAG TPA: hypothetical protein GX524_02570 [Firmicutes bacterium]|nr:hypothetical protein [Bacillota bacterium]